MCHSTMWSLPNYIIRNVKTICNSTAYFNRGYSVQKFLDLCKNTPRYFWTIEPLTSIHESISNPVHHKVNSQVLAHASTVLEKLRKNALEAEPINLPAMQSERRSLPILRLKEDASTFVIIFDVIHFRTACIPSHLPVSKMAELAVMVERYQLHGPMGLRAQCWLKKIQETTLHPQSFESWLISCYIFKAPIGRMISSRIFKQACSASAKNELALGFFNYTFGPSGKKPNDLASCDTASGAVQHFRSCSKIGTTIKGL